MTNLWPESFNIEGSKPVKKILEEQGSFLPELTNNMVLTEVKSMDSKTQLFDKHMNQFAYSFFLKGRFLKNYSYKILDFSHPITIYPVEVTIDKVIAKNIGVENRHVIDNESDFIILLSSILRSEHLIKIVGSIMKLSPEQMT